MSVMAQDSQATRIARVWQVLGDVLDPEVPALSVCDLGIVRAVQALDDAADGVLEIVLTPTYSGCPAVGRMCDDVADVLREAGYRDVQVRVVLSPAWTTDWMSPEGRAKLRRYGIAPPGPRADGPVPLALSVRCPQCGSPDTRESSRFGSTACKSLWICQACREPFDHFKTL